MVSDPVGHEGEGIQGIEGEPWWWRILVAASHRTQQVGVNTAADLVSSASMEGRYFDELEDHLLPPDVHVKKSHFL